MSQSLIEDFADIAARLNKIERDRMIDAIKPDPEKPTVTTGYTIDWTDVDGPFCC